MRENTEDKLNVFNSSDRQCFDN